VSYASSTTAAYVYLDAAQGYAEGAYDTIGAVENVVGSAYDDTLYGSSLANLIAGGLGNDVLWGANGGLDTLDGAQGNDTLYGGSGGTVIWGGAGDDYVSGAEAVDNVSGGAGDDLIYGSGGNDVLGGNEGKDTIYGGDGNDLLNGGAGGDSFSGDVLDGGAGNDTLIGGANYDEMTGGTGSDVFRYTSIVDALAHFEYITDFTQGQDLIDLVGVDANETVAGNQAFTLGGEQGSFTAVGQVIWSHLGGFTYISLNTDNDSGSEGAIALAGEIDLTAADFWL
jgi:Ca2+-binding RTX toxin-like protein